MKLCSSLGNPECTGNFFVRQAPHQQLKYLCLAGRQRMARQKLCLQQRSDLLDVSCQDFRRHPDLSFQEAADRQGQFGRPSLVQVNKAVYTPIKEPNFLGVVAGYRGEQSKKLASGRMGANPGCQRAQVRLQRTRVQRKSRARLGDSFTSASSEAGGKVRAEKRVRRESISFTALVRTGCELITWIAISTAVPACSGRT